MFKLSRLTDYSVVILGRMIDAGQGQLLATTELAESTGLPHPTVSKILKLLVRSGVVTSHRGTQGGYSLDQDPATISIAQIITALDGPVALTSCVDGAEGNCVVEHNCPMRGRWDPLNLAVKQALDSVSLLEIATYDPVPDFISSGQEASSRPMNDTTTAKVHVA